MSLSLPQFSIEDDGTPHVKLTLWKRELLVGTMELDVTQMRVHKLDQNCSLIMGRSSGQILKQPLHRILDVPHRMTWDQLMGGKRKQAVPGKVRRWVDPEGG